MAQNEGVGTLFTDEQHSITFLDKVLNAYLNSQQETDQSIIGTPVFKLFGFTLSEYMDFLEQYTSNNVIEDVNLDLIKLDGNTLSTILSGQLNKDKDGKLIGVEYQISPTSTFVAPVNISRVNDHVVNELLQFYFRRQLEGLHATAVKWGGEQVGVYLIEVVNQTSEKNGWKIKMTADKIEMSDDITSLDVYLTIMKKVVEYGSQLIGDKLVYKQVRVVNEAINPATFDYIDRKWFMP